MENNKSIRKAAKELANKCADAYSADRYASWPAVAEWLLRKGYTEAEAEAIMRSKWTRWAADASSNRYGRNTAADLAAWMANEEKRMGRTKFAAEVVTMTKESGL